MAAAGGHGGAHPAFLRPAEAGLASGLWTLNPCTRNRKCFGAAHNQPFNHRNGNQLTNRPQARWYWGANSMDDVSGAWPRKDVDEFVFSKFPAAFTTDFITVQKPRLCLTLAHPVTLDDMCGPFGRNGGSGRGLGCNQGVIVMREKGWAKVPCVWQSMGLGVRRFGEGTVGLEGTEGGSGLVLRNSGAGSKGTPAWALVER